MAHGAHVIDVDEADFQAAVLDKSHEVPVLVDFWAPWCGPCRMLGPLLEGLAEEKQGAFLLAKVNTDENPGLSQSFGIRGIPAVKAFRGGVEVDGFVGVQTRPFIEQLLGRLAPSEAEILAAEGRKKLEVGEVDEALDLFRAAVSQGATDADILIGLGEALLLGGHIEEAHETLSEVREGEEGYEEAQGLLVVVGFHQALAAVGGEEAALGRLDADPNDHAARYAAAGARFIDGDHRGALEGLLELVRRNKAWNGDAGRKTMLAVFQRIGNRSPLADEFRTKLSRTLY